MQITPDSWLYPGYEISVPEKATSAQLVGFARQFSLWAEAKLAAENRLKKLNSKMSSERA